MLGSGHQQRPVPRSPRSGHPAGEKLRWLRRMRVNSSSLEPASVLETPGGAVQRCAAPRSWPPGKHSRQGSASLSYSGFMHAKAMHCWGFTQIWQMLPAVPHASFVVPSTHVPSLLQQVSPVQPAPQVPPQPSGPHSLPVQSGVQTGAVHLPSVAPCASRDAFLRRNARKVRPFRQKVDLRWWCVSLCTPLPRRVFASPSSATRSALAPTSETPVMARSRLRRDPPSATRLLRRSNRESSKTGPSPVPLDPALMSWSLLPGICTYSLVPA